MKSKAVITPSTMLRQKHSSHSVSPFIFNETPVIQLNPSYTTLAGFTAALDLV